MPGLLAVGAENVNPDGLALDFRAVGPLVINRLSLPHGAAVQFTNPKFLNDKVFEEDDDLFVGLDGVVFNFRQLKAKYHADSYFGTVKAMVAELGDTFFKEFRGECAGVVYDKRRRRWIAFTNHTASKPMFYYHAPGVFVCSTDFDVMVQTLRAMNRNCSLDTVGAYYLLTFGYMLEDTTLVSEVRKLKAGCYLTCDGPSLAVDTYVRFTNEPYVDDSEEDIIARVDDLFKEAVRLQYEKDREYGYDHLATLSGGLDSRMNVMVACDLGYRAQVALTFAQTHYLDERLAKQIATDFGLEFVFYALDGGHYLEPMLDPAFRANGGLIFFAGSAHLLAALCRVDTVRTGLLHTGMLGDAVLGSYVSQVPPCKAKHPWGAYDTHLLDRVLPEVKAAGDQYATEYEFVLYNRGFNGTLNGNWTTYQLTECTSPFLDWDMLAYNTRIPRELQYREQVYLDWILARYPQAARYVWEKRKAKITDGPMLRRLKKAWWIAGIVLRNRWDQVSMNPFEAWYKSNPALKEFLDGYWRDHADVLDASPELKRDCDSLFHKAGPSVLAKTQVITLLEAVRRYFT